MALFFPLLLKMIGLYLFVGLGFLAMRKLDVNRESISQLLFHLIVPLVFLHGVSKTPLTGALLALPFILMAMSCLLALLGYFLARRLWPEAGDRTANIVGFTAGNGNMGYFGIPVALLIFDQATLAVYMLMIIGVILYESTLGYAIATRGHFHPRDALRKILTLPMLHGSLLGLVLALLQWPLPAFLEDFFLAVRGAYSVLGMMVVGMGLAGLTRFELDFKFLSVTFVLKFISWPLLAFAVVWMDAHYFQLYSHNIHDALMLIALAPLAVMSVIFATMLNAHPEKMATAVFLSTCFALVYVPLMISLLGLGGIQ